MTKGCKKALNRSIGKRSVGGRSGLSQTFANIMRDAGIVAQPVPERRRIDWGLVGTWLFWLAVIGGGAWYLTHYFLTQAREHHATEIRQQQTDASIAALALKYNTATNWEASLPDRGAGEPLSTPAIQPCREQEMKMVSENSD